MTMNLRGVRCFGGKALGPCKPMVRLWGSYYEKRAWRVPDSRQDKLYEFKLRLQRMRDGK